MILQCTLGGVRAASKSTRRTGFCAPLSTYITAARRDADECDRYARRCGHAGRESYKFSFAFQAHGCTGFNADPAQGLPDDADESGKKMLQIARGPKIVATALATISHGQCCWEQPLEFVCTLYSSKKDARLFSEKIFACLSRSRWRTRGSSVRTRWRRWIWTWRRLRAGRMAASRGGSTTSCASPPSEAARLGRLDSPSPRPQRDWSFSPRSAPPFSKTSKWIRTTHRSRRSTQRVWAAATAACAPCRSSNAREASALHEEHGAPQPAPPPPRPTAPPPPPQRRQCCTSKILEDLRLRRGETWRRTSRTKTARTARTATTCP